MGTGQSNRQTPVQEQLTQWWRRHPYLLGPGWIIIWLIAKARGTLAVVFATWPSMHDPISNLLNAADAEEADRLTEKWTDAKLKELNYVGISVCKTESSFHERFFTRISCKVDPYLMVLECTHHRHHRLRFFLVLRSRRSMEYRGMLDKRAGSGLDSYQPCHPADNRSQPSV